MTDQIISEGEKWMVVDVLDDAIIASFSSWNTFDPEGRAREIFMNYPRESTLFCQKVVTYERHAISHKEIGDA